LVIPPLRERRIDIPDLAEELAARQAKRLGLEAVRFAPRAIAKLAGAAWPGNVRQLENVVTRLIAMSSGGDLDFDPTLGLELDPEPSVADAYGDTAPLADQVHAFECSLVKNAYLAAGRNQTETARRLSIGRSTLIIKLKKYGLC